MSFVRAAIQRNRPVVINSRQVRASRPKQDQQRKQDRIAKQNQEAIANYLPDLKE